MSQFGEAERGRGTVAFDKVLWYAKNLGMGLIESWVRAAFRA